MKSILKEEKKIEDFKNQSYDIEKLGIAGEIFCTKSLVISTGLQKGKVKALLQAAKEVEKSAKNDVENYVGNEYDLWLLGLYALDCTSACSWKSYCLLLCAWVRSSTDYYELTCERVYCAWCILVRGFFCACTFLK